MSNPFLPAAPVNSVTSPDVDEESVLLSSAHDEPFHDHVPSGTTIGTYLNILKNIIGSGMLALPYAFSLSGWAVGLLIMAGIQVAAVICLYFIMRCADIIRSRGGDPTSYQDLATEAWNARVGKAIEVVVMCYTCGTLIAYGVLLVQNFQQPIVEMGGPHIPKGVILLLAGAVVLPLCCLEHIEYLKFSSVLGNVVLVYVAGLVAYYYWNTSLGDDATVVAATEGGGFLQAMPMMLFAYNFHYNMPIYYRELRNRSTKKMLGIVGSVYVTVSFLYLLICLTGYATFGHLTKSNILGNLPPSDTAVKICNLGVGLMILSSYPVVQFAARGAIARLQATSPSCGTITRRKRIVIASVTVTVTLAISAAIPNIGVVLGFNGAIFGIVQHYLLPCGAFLGLSLRYPSVPTWERRLAAATFLLGLSVGILGVAGTTINVLHSDDR